LLSFQAELVRLEPLALLEAPEQQVFKEMLEHLEQRDQLGLKVQLDLAQQAQQALLAQLVLGARLVRLVLEQLAQLD
jgi:hypothetical protein